ncbi:unnamed protein product [Lathyrus oleraceus]|nr:uncharacterized protein LOC127119187 isoform X2 [Pisum sativum]
MDKNGGWKQDSLRLFDMMITGFVRHFVWCGRLVMVQLCRSYPLAFTCDNDVHRLGPWFAVDSGSAAGLRLRRIIQGCWKSVWFLAVSWEEELGFCFQILLEIG